MSAVGTTALSCNNCANTCTILGLLGSVRVKTRVTLPGGFLLGSWDMSRDSCDLRGTGGGSFGFGGGNGDSDGGAFGDKAGGFGGGLGSPDGGGGGGFGRGGGGCDWFDFFLSLVSSSTTARSDASAYGSRLCWVFRFFMNRGSPIQ